MNGAAVTRRQAAGLAGASAVALLLPACGDGGEDSETSRFGDGDIGVLNYLLTLEHVSSAFYVAVDRSHLFSGSERSLFAEFGRQEDQHAAALTKAVEGLGGAPARAPGTRFQFAGRDAALSFAARLESIVAAGYLHQVSNVEERPALAIVTAIHSVEGRHAAAIDILRGDSFSPEGAFAKGAPARRVLRLLQPVASV